MMKSTPWTGFPAEAPRLSSARRLTAALLRAASRLLARMARAVAAQHAGRPAAPRALEFYAEAGAPEGALYADGRLLGHIEGVSRL